MEEEWRDIERYEGHYQISDEGRVKSLVRVVDRVVNGRTFFRTVPEKILQPNPTGSGRNYFSVVLHLDGKKYTRRVHQLVLEAFVGPRPEGLEGCHNDGDSFNNRLDNLRWDTPSNNQQDRRLHGTDLYGEKNPLAKLDKAQVLEIRALAGSLLQKDIAKQFGVSRSTITGVIARKTWNFV